jgi:hypothetical protein
MSRGEHGVEAAECEGDGVVRAGFVFEFRALGVADVELGVPRCRVVDRRAW